MPHLICSELAFTKPSASPSSLEDLLDDSPWVWTSSQLLEGSAWSTRVVSFFSLRITTATPISRGRMHTCGTFFTRIISSITGYLNGIIIIIHHVIFCDMIVSSTSNRVNIISDDTDHLLTLSFFVCSNEKNNQWLILGTNGS